MSALKVFKGSDIKESFSILKNGILGISSKVSASGGILGAFKALVGLHPVITAVAGAIVAMTAAYATMQYFSFDGFYKRATKDREALEETQKSISETTASIEENNNKIQELKNQQANGNYSKSLGNEISKLEQENVILEQQKKLYEEKLKLERQQAAKSAGEALTQTDLYSKAVFNPETGMYETQWEKRTIIDNIRADIEKSQELQKALDDNADSIANLDTSSKKGQKQFKVLSDQRKNLQTALLNTQTSINNQKEQVLNLYNSLFDNDGNIIAGYEDIAKRVESAFPEFNPSKYVRSQFVNRRDGGSDLIKWYSELSSDQQKIVFDLVLNSDTATWDLEKFKSELETTEKVAKLLQDANPLEDFKSSVTKAIENQNNLTAALAAGNSATGMTFEQMQNVIEAFSQIEEFDMADLFERTATGVQMNTKAFKAYNKELQLQTQLELMTAIQQKQQEITNARLKGTDTTDLEKQLSYFQLLLSEYEGSISKYNAYVTASSSANNRDSYGNVVAGYKSVKELIKAGWVTDDSVTSYLDLVLGENWKSDFGTASRAFDQLSTKIDGTNNSLKDYLTTDSSGNLTSQGVWRFAEDAVKLGFGSKGEDGLVKLNLTGNKLDQIAEKLGTSTEMVELFGKALSDAGMDVSFDSAGTKLENVNKRIADLKSELAKMPDGEDKIQKALELKGLQDKQLKYSVDVALSKDGAKSISELLSMDDKELTTYMGVELKDADAVRKYLEQVGQSTGEIPIKVRLDEGQLQSILNHLTGTVTVTPQVEGTPEIPDTSIDVEPRITGDPKIPDQVVKVTPVLTSSLNVASTKVNATLGSSPRTAPTITGVANYKLGQVPRTAPSISGTANYRGNFSGIGSAPTLSGTVKYKGDFSGVGTAPTRASGTMTKVAHADGTAYNVLNYQRLSPSHAGGRVSLPADEYALTNEIGRESIVRDGVWYMLPPGPHMEHLKKGDIIFSAKQTEDLLRAGKTSTYARALSAGTLNALANGTIHAYSGYTGSGYNPWASSGNYNGGNYVGSGSSSIGSGASSGGGSNTSDKSVDNKVDWIEIAIKRFEILLNKLKNIAENTFNSLITRLDATNENIDATTKSIEFQTEAYDRYIKEANSIGLDAGIAEKVRNGDIDINTYNEDTRKKIEEYQKWYEKAEDCSDAIEELKTSLAELYKSKFDNIQKNYENRLDLMEKQAKQFDIELTRLEAQGYRADSSIYQSQIADRQKRIATMKTQLEDLQAAFDYMIDNKSIEEDSEAYYEMMLEIQNVKNEISETEIEVLQLSNTIRDLEWDSFDRALESISDLNDEADFLIDLLGSGKLTDDAGNLNDDGLAVLGLHAQKLDTFMAKSQKYADEIARLDKEISKDPMNETLIGRRKELLKLQREAITAANDEKEAMKELASDGFDAQLESVKKLIDAYSDSLDSAKDLYEFQKSITEKTQSIAEIEKQLAAYQGDTSQETRATIQKLKDDLKKANEDLNDTEYDRYVSDTKKLLDELYIDYEDAINSKLDDVDALVEELIEAVNNNAESILNIIREATDKVGIGLSDEITGIWEGDNHDWGIISSNSDLMAEKMSSVLDAVNAIYRNTCLMSGESATMSFASGGLVDYTGKANVHGTKSKPELMLNARDTKNFLELRDILRELPQVDLAMRTSVKDVNISVPEIASILNAAGNGGCTFGDINIEIDHVENYDDFVNQLQHDKKFEGMIQSMTVGRLSGKSSLDKYSYSWKN